MDDNDSDIPDITADFWIKFDKTGDIVMRMGNIKVMYDLNEKWLYSLDLVEDQLFLMNTKIYKSFFDTFTEFDNDKNILTLERYFPIAKAVFNIDEEWEALCKKQNIKLH